MANQQFSERVEPAAVLAEQYTYQLVGTLGEVARGTLGKALTEEDVHLVAAEMVKYVAPIAPDEPATCMDGRPVMGLMSDEPTKVRAKMAGGQVASGFAGEVLTRSHRGIEDSDAVDKSAPPADIVKTQFEPWIEKYAGSKGMHVSGHVHGAGCGCGMLDSFPIVLRVVADEGVNQPVDRLGPVVATLMRGPFRQDVHQGVVKDAHAFWLEAKDNGIMPSSHVGCGAAAGFATIAENAIAFSKDERFAARQQALLPEGVYDADLHEQMLQANQERLQRGLYDGLTADVFLEAVETVSGKQAIAELKDDGRGVHGHVEEAIVRVRVPGKAIDEAKVAAVTGGREVFGVNDTRMDRIAHLFGRGADEDYRIAYMALEDFADCGHGTLAHSLPTYVVSRA